MKRTVIIIVLLALALTFLAACYPWKIGTFHSPLWVVWGDSGPGTIAWRFRR